MLSEIERYVNWVRRRNPHARTWKDYGYDLRIFVAVVGDLAPDQITFQEVDRFIDELSRRGLKPNTINRRLAAIQGFYTFLASEGQDLICPIRPRRHHLREPQRLPRPVREEDLIRFFSVIHNSRDRAMFLLMLCCGLRISEVASVQFADLCFDPPFPQLLVHGKGSHERTVYLSPQAAQSLRTYLAERPPAAWEHVFLGETNRPISTAVIHKRLVRYRMQSDVCLSAHRLRHTFANNLLNARVPITSIQKLLGHRWIETTQNYAIANDLQVREDYFAACQRLDAWGTLELADLPDTDLGNHFCGHHRSASPIPDAQPIKQPSQKGQCQRLPEWLGLELHSFLRLRRLNWRSSRERNNTSSYWSIQFSLWEFLCNERNVQKITDLKKQDLLDYIDMRLSRKRLASSINAELVLFRSFLLFLQEKGYVIPQNLLCIPFLKSVDTLPRFLPPGQISAIQHVVEEQARKARPEREYVAVLDRAIFYLLWQSGLRVGEVESLRLTDLELAESRIVVTDSKGRKSRIVYLSPATKSALCSYMFIRSGQSTGFVFRIGGLPLKRGGIYRHMRAIGNRAGVCVTPHRLRHSCATQLLNAGCPVTSIQKYLGHKKLNTTLIYARANDRVVAEAFFRALPA